MTTLRVKQISKKILEMFQQHLDLSDVPQKDPDRDQKILSRCLAAFAIYFQTGCTEQEAALSVWDGSEDNGIDAAYFDPSERKVVFVQAKWINKGSGEPEAKDLGAFVKGVRDAIEQDNTNFSPKLHAKFNDLALKISTPGVSIELVVVTTGSSNLAKHGSAVINNFLSEINGDEIDALALSKIIGLAEVYSRLANDPLQSNIAVDATILDWSYIATPFAAYYGMIDGLSLKNWWQKFGKGLVSSNIRHSLGSTDVNNEIKNSALNAPTKFWYFNNGITLVANEAEKAPAGAASRSAGVFSFKGASIVNGAQTVSSLAKVDDDSQLGLVRVPIRVILLKDAPVTFGNEVTRTNNLQNRVEPRDFVAQDPEQNRLRQEMAIEGIDYQYVRSEEAVPTATSCELAEVTTALACASGDANLAVQIKTGIGRFFIDLKKPPYKTIFNPNTSGAKAFNATIILREIESWIDKKKKSLNKKSGPIWGALVHGNRIFSAIVFSKIDDSVLSQPIAEFKESLEKLQIPNLCEETHSNITKQIEEKYSGKVLAVLFKNPSMSKDIFDSSSAKKIKKQA